MTWNRCNTAWIGEVDAFAMFCAFVGKNTSESRNMANELSPLHLYLELLDDDLSLGKFRQIHRLSWPGKKHVPDEELPRFENSRNLEMRPQSVFYDTSTTVSASLEKPSHLNSSR